MFNKKSSKKEPLLNAEIEDSNARASETIKNASAVMGSMDIMQNEGKTNSAIDRHSEQGGGGDEEEGATRQKKRGHRLFFCCCDSKRAVVWINMAILLLNLFTFTNTIMNVDSETEGYMQVLIIKGCGILVTLATIVGAFMYSKSIVFVGLMFACYQLSMALIKIVRNGEGGDDTNTAVLYLVINLVNFYAEAVFISEVTDEVLTPETYKARERSCCCFNI